MENINTLKDYKTMVKKLGISEAAFCRAAKVHQTTIVRWKNGTHKDLSKGTERKLVAAFKRLSKG